MKLKKKIVKKKKIEKKNDGCFYCFKLNVGDMCDTCYLKVKKENRLIKKKKNVFEEKDETKDVL